MPSQHQCQFGQDLILPSGTIRLLSFQIVFLRIDCIVPVTLRKIEGEKMKKTLKNRFILQSLIPEMSGNTRQLQMCRILPPILVFLWTNPGHHLIFMTYKRRNWTRRTAKYIGYNTWVGSLTNSWYVGSVTLQPIMCTLLYNWKKLWNNNLKKIFFKSYLIYHSAPENLKKSRPKNSWNQINQKLFFLWNCIFGSFKLFPSSKIHFCPVLKLQKMDFGPKNFFM